MAMAGGTIVAMGNWKPTPIQMRDLNVNHLGPLGEAIMGISHNATKQVSAGWCR